MWKVEYVAEEAITGDMKKFCIEDEEFTQEQALAKAGASIRDITKNSMLVMVQPMTSPMHNGGSIVFLDGNFVAAYLNFWEE